MNTIVADLLRPDSIGGIKKGKESDDKKGPKFDEILKDRRDQKVPAEGSKEQKGSSGETEPELPGSELLSAMLLAGMPQMPANPGAVQETDSAVMYAPVPEVQTAEKPVSEQEATAAVTGNGQAETGKETAGERFVPVMKNTAGEQPGMTEQTPKLTNPVVHENENFQNTDKMPEISKVLPTAKKVSDTTDKEQSHKDAPVTSLHGPESGQRAPEQTKVSDRAPVKSGDVQAEDISAEYMEQLKSDIIKHVASGKQQFEIQLNPANLGKMIIKASYEAGKAVISIVCSETKAMQAMSQQARELGAMMEARTGTQTEVIVDRPSEDYLQQQAEQEGRGQGDESRRQQNENKKTKYHDSLDFLQQLRLGLA